MSINLCTTGQGSVRFNPNLYNDGKVMQHTSTNSCSNGLTPMLVAVDIYVVPV